MLGLEAPSRAASWARPGLGIRVPRVLASIFSTGSDTQVSGEMFPDSGPVRIRDPSLSSAQRVLGKYAINAYPIGDLAAAQRGSGGGCHLLILEIKYYVLTMRGLGRSHFGNNKYGTDKVIAQ